MKKIVTKSSKNGKIVTFDCWKNLPVDSILKKIDKDNLWHIFWTVNVPFPHFLRKRYGPTDRRTDRRTDGPRDIPSYRDARTHLKTDQKIKGLFPPPAHASMHTCIHACMHAPTLARTHPCLHARTYACTHAPTLACTHACTRAKILDNILRLIDWLTDFLIIHEYFQVHRPSYWDAKIVLASLVNILWHLFAFCFLTKASRTDGSYLWQKKWRKDTSISWPNLLFF